jgi:hypothetical protein
MRKRLYVVGDKMAMVARAKANGQKCKSIPKTLYLLSKLSQAAPETLLYSLTAVRQWFFVLQNEQTCISEPIA